jgi:hypothetical protein
MQASGGHVFFMYRMHADPHIRGFSYPQRTADQKEFGKIKK